MTNRERIKELARLSRRIELAKYNALRWMTYARDLTNQAVTLAQDGVTREHIRLKMFPPNEQLVANGIKERQMADEAEIV